MQFQLPASPRASIIRNVFRSKIGLKTFQSILKSRRYHKELLPELLERRWALLNPDANIHKVSLFETQLQHREGPNITFSFTNNTRPSLGDNLKEKTGQELSFYVVRDDLLHPLVNGNKARKLDGLLPLIEDHAVTDVVTCGGCQSAHAAAVAVSCAERGLRSHLLLRGEQPEIPTGYNLISAMYGNVMYVPRSLYTKREEMLSGHADIVAGRDGTVVWLNNILDTSLGAQEYGKANFAPLASHQSSFTGTDAKEHQRKVAIVNEGAGDVAGLLGVIRVVEFLSQTHLFGSDRALKIVVDAGTGTTAVGLGLGAVCLSLPWEVCGVMLADTIEGYKKQEEHLILEFKRAFGIGHVANALNRMDGGIVHWVERIHPRKFGNVLKGEVEMCQQIARQTGILVDPIYTLAAWEHATLLCQSKTDAGADVVMLHTGGTLGMFGLAQRYKSYFDAVQYADYSNLS